MHLAYLAFPTPFVTPTETPFQRFLRNLRDAKLYENWRKANPGESLRFDTYLAAVLAGEPSSPPSMLTAFGRALVAVVEMRQQSG